MLLPRHLPSEPPALEPLRATHARIAVTVDIARRKAANAEFARVITAPEMHLEAAVLKRKPLRNGDSRLDYLRHNITKTTS